MTSWKQIWRAYYQTLSMLGRPRIWLPLALYAAIKILLMFFYVATVNTPAMVMKMVGLGSQYAGAMRDSLGNAFDGGRTYQLHIPSNVPAKDFWSLVVYDTQTRSELQTGNPFPSLNNKRNAIEENPDGSVDVYFGPRAPKGKESNWIETVPGKSWFNWKVTVC